MHASAIRKLTLLALIVGQLSLFCGSLARHGRRKIGRTIKGIRVPSLYERRSRPKHPPTTFAPCLSEGSLCSEVGDCLLPQFQCVGNGRCISRAWLCNGIVDCSDGSDEWGCETTFLDFTTIVTMNSESEDDFSSSTTTRTTLQDIEIKSSATNVIFPEFNPSSSPTVMTSTMVLTSEVNSITPLSTADTIHLNFESSATMQSSTTSSVTLPESKGNIVVPSLTTSNRRFSDFETSTAFYKVDTTKSPSLYSEAITTSSSVPADISILPEKTSTPATNIILPVSGPMQSCPDNYCMNNAECLVVQGQYLCKCPSSFIGEICEIQLGSDQHGPGYVMPIVIFTTLVFLSLATVSVCVYYCKRLSTRKHAEMSNRSLSQLTLTSNAVE